VHRVEGLEPGLYILLRSAAVCDRLRAALHSGFVWTKPSDCPEHLRFFQLAAGGCGPLARTLHCHQAIAADSAFALGMVAEYQAALTAAPWRYRQLHWEAGLLGQALYLEAEAMGLRGTGIGCYFDDRFHELLGLSGNAFQSLYHFTVGYPLTDSRILTLPPYPERQSKTGESPCF
jgi:nitroreductase